MCASYVIREYQDRDADSWLRCRLLSFFHTNYYDDVVTERPAYAHPSARHVAAADKSVVGILDAQVDGANATIEVLAVHPDHARRGIATALLRKTEAALARYAVSTLDAWTREDVPANQWYQRAGFVENFSYLHVHKVDADDATGFETPPGLSRPLTAFMHASRDHEASLRQRFRRVYVCRRYVKTFNAPPDSMSDGA
ncbi:GNAT family N-acetyltransferase [Actinopolymorpha sp. B9G3]|uniref:GNAT family N-acetyltransferase n=1 Tax=Actinopolymorpha sp. B9G3 TaxID=3158970 RepID=UPI0032D8D52F